MKTFTAALTLALATIGLAASAPAIEKRVTGSITLYSQTNYNGASLNIPVNLTPNGGNNCLAATLPENLNNQVSSLRLSAEHPGFYCQLVDQPNCVFGDTGSSTWAIDVSVPNLSPPSEYNFDNRASSVWCVATQ